jgi:ketosteroid isomerase-like protein
MRRFRYVVAVAAIAVLAACQKLGGSPAAPHTAKLTEAEAIRIATTPLTGWDKENAKALDTAYAPDAIGFDASTAPLVPNGAAFVKINQDFMAMKFDKVNVRLQKAQIISDDAFIFTSYTDLASTHGPGKPSSWRCTGVFQRQSDNKFRMINEHCSFPPGR